MEIQMKLLVTIILLWIILGSGSSQSAGLQNVSLCYELSNYVSEVVVARDRGLSLAEAIKIIYSNPEPTPGSANALATMAIGVYQSSKSRQELQYSTFDYCIKGK